MVIGVFNLVYVIPSQTLFAERTPAGPHGSGRGHPVEPRDGRADRCHGVCSGLAESVDAGVVIAFTGLLTVLAGVIAAFLPAVRDV